MQNIISALEAAKADLAVSVLTDPKRDPYEHGYQVGMYAGMERAISLAANPEGPAPVARKERESVYG